jgi:hypothetical protein
MKARVSVVQEPESALSPLACDAVTGLVGAFAWASLVAWRLGTAVPRLHVFVAVLGCSAATLAPLLAIGRGARPMSLNVQSILAGAVLATGPLSVFGAQLGEKTHHRALGAVTYAFAALLIVALCSAMARRCLSLAVVTPRSKGSRWPTVARSALAVVAALSLVSLVVPLRSAVGVALSRSASEAIGDGLVGVVLVGAGMLVPRWPVSSREARRAFTAFVVAVALGGVVVARDAGIRGALLSRAPAALGPGWLLGG